MRRTNPFAFSVIFAAGILCRQGLLGQGPPITGTAQVGAVPAPLSTGVGATVQLGLSVDISGVTGRNPSGTTVPAVLGGYQITVSFDQTRLRFDSASGGASPGYTSAPTYTNAAIANAAGSLTLVASQTSATSPTGVISLATLSFTTLAAGTASIAANPVSVVSAYQPGPPSVGPAAIPGAGGTSSVTILGPTPPPPTPTPPGATPTPTPPEPPPAIPTPTATPPPPAPAGGRSVTLPVAAHVNGVGGFVFVTDLQIQNPTSRIVEAELLFFRAGATDPYRVRLILAPGETRSYFDVIGNRFGLTNAVGALRLNAESGLRMTSRTYTRVGEGTFGLAVSGVMDPEETTASRHVTGLARTQQFRSNLGAVNPSGSPQRFHILLKGRDGAPLGESPALELPPGTQMQLSLGDLFPHAGGTGLTAEFRPVPGYGAPLAYAAVVDNASGDPTYFPATRAHSLVYLPGVARVTGAGGTLFLSDISFANPADSAQNITVTFLERDRDNNSGAPSVTFALGPHETRQLDDALGELFGVSETYGALRISSSSDSGVLVSERISTASTTTGGTVGQQVDPVSPESLMARGSILGLRHDAAFRSNVGFLNPNPSPAEIALALQNSQGETLAARTIELLPNSYTQRTLAALFPGTSLQARGTLTLSVDARGARIFPFATVVDNISQDSTFSPGLR